MEKGNTKQEIFDAALNLFSTKGYEATSVSEIAEAVGIKKASLYSHFASKQEILDSLIEILKKQYDKNSIFANTDWDNPTFTKDKANITADDVTKAITRHVNYILHDPAIQKARKMLTIEQFGNPQMAKIQTKQNYTDVMNYFIGMMKFLARSGKLTDDDTEIIAAQLCLPISVWINLCDREPERKNEIFGLIERHVNHFFKTYNIDNGEQK
mgnify:CR=1 FL=1